MISITTGCNDMLLVSKPNFQSPEQLIILVVIAGLGGVINAEHPVIIATA
jgi:hypothetical protein